MKERTDEGLERRMSFIPRDDDIVAREIKRKGAITSLAVRHIINEVCSGRHSSSDVF